MKPLTILFLFAVLFGNSQKKNIQTHATTLQDLITYVVDNYKTNADSFSKKHINVLLQVGEEGYSTEDRILIHQAFKLFSSRLSENDVISISTYSQLNGIALKQGNPRDLKQLLFVLDNLKPSIKELHDDGISAAYAFMEDTFNEEGEHIIIMVRNPLSLVKTSSALNTNSKKKSKQRSNAIVLTAIALLPELISVIKD